MDYDFSGLTPRQQQLLAAGGWRLGMGQSGGKQPSPHTVRKLLDRGLLVAAPRRFMLATITEYSVPEAVAAAWGNGPDARSQTSPTNQSLHLRPANEGND